MARSFLKGLSFATLFLVGGPSGALAQAPNAPVAMAPPPAERTDLLDMANGAVVLSKSSEYGGAKWSALALVDGAPDVGWCSADKAPFPHEVLIELARRASVESIVFDQTQAQDSGYAGISSKDVEVWASNASPADGFAKALQIQLPQGGKQEFRLPAPVTARWLKFVIRSNWGNANYTELMELEAYGQPVPGPAAQAPLTGTYNTNYGPITLNQAGSTVTGCYYDGDGSLNGTTDGRVVQVEWRQNGGKKFGTALMVLSARGDFLNGFWYEHGSLAGSWFGDRPKDGGKSQCRTASAAPGAAAQEPSAIATNIAQTGRAIIYGVLFDTASDRIRAESDPTLNEVLGLMQAQPALNLEISGHTDSVGNDAYNQDLSKRRAQSVVAWLTAKGVAAGRLTAAGYGKTQPVADNATPQGRALNRRVELAKK
ncbi:MAG TPA: OmpA family protein [bacterium]|nr:OmpA family protein [bacterium]